MNKDAASFELGSPSGAARGQNRPADGIMPFAYVLLGAIAFPLVLVAGLSSGMGLVAAGLAAFALSGPVAFIVYLGLALTTNWSN